MSMQWLAATMVAAAASTIVNSAAVQAQDAAAHPPERRHMHPTLSVRGEAQLDRPADRLVMRLSVITQATEAPQAMQQNSRKMAEVVAAMQKVGLGEREFQTGRFNVQPLYSHPPRQPQPDWRPQITGYQVTNTVEVKTTKLEIAGQLIQAATDAGANQIESISFDLADPRKHRAEAIREATRNAISDAEALAQAAGQRLVRVVSITLDHADPRPPVMFDHAMRGMAMEAAAVPPITPGDVTVHATVNIVYQIEGIN